MTNNTDQIAEAFKQVAKTARQAGISIGDARRKPNRNQPEKTIEQLATEELPDPRIPKLIALTLATIVLILSLGLGLTTGRLLATEQAFKQAQDAWQQREMDLIDELAELRNGR